MRRFRIGGLAALTILALALPAGHARPLHLVAPAKEGPLYGLTYGPSGATLSRLDPQALLPVLPRLPVRYVDSWAFSPDHRLLALAAHESDMASVSDTLRLIALGPMRPVRRVIPMSGFVQAALWARPDRIVAVVGGCCDSTASVSVVDPALRRILETRSLDGAVLRLARTGGLLVLLVTPPNKIGTPKLVTVDAAGAVRTAVVDRLRAGMSWPEDTTTDPIGTQRVPGLAVDPAGKRAFVVDPDGSVAEIDLASLAVAYHAPVEARSPLARLDAWLQPAAQAKGLNGVSVSAQWLGDGFLAFAGSEETATLDAHKNMQHTGRPTGLRIVDTRGWTSRLLDPGADSFAVANGLLLATGSRWDDATNSGMGLAAYRTDWSRQFQLLAGKSAWVAAAFDGRAYVSDNGGNTMQVVDLASGRIVDERAGQLPELMLADGP